MQSKAATVGEYLAKLPPERRSALEGVRAVILRNMDPVFEEGMQYGMIGYYVPHRVFPSGYHCDPKQPLPFICLGSQKNYMSLHLGCIHMHAERARRFREAWAKTGKKLDMGKACIRFRKIDDLALDVISDTIRRLPARTFIAEYESITQSRRRGTSSSRKRTAGSRAAKAKRRARSATSKRGRRK